MTDCPQAGVRARAVLVLFGLLLLPFHLTLADVWYESYEKAEDALAAEDWEEAINQINLALEKKGDSSARARVYGVNFIKYFPYFKLGIAYYHLGQLDAAQQAFDTEERLGAIAESGGDQAELERYRGLIGQAREQAAAEEQRRIAQIVADTLAEAKGLEGQGQFEEALTVLGNALAVAPEDATLATARQRILDGISAQQQRLELETRIAGLLEQGRNELSAGRYQEAASTFDRALNLRESEELRGLLEQAQAQLRARIEAQQDAERIAVTISEGLRSARELEATGDLVAALDELQTVLVLDADNAEARTIQTRLLDLQARREAERTTKERVLGLLTEAQASFDSGDFQAALAASHRALDRDPESEAARGLVVAATRAISRDLLGTLKKNLPPVVRFSDFRNYLLADLVQVERVNTPLFRVQGTILDDSEVELGLDHAFLGGFRDEEVDSAMELAFAETDGNPQEQVPFRDRVIRRNLAVRSNASEFGDTFLYQFSAERTLEPGLSVFQMTATDVEGLSQEMKYAVLYVRPWHRSPWLYSLFGVVAVGVAGGTVGYRIHRRNKVLKRRFNPYIAGAPILKDDIFFGRERLLSRVLQTIHNNSILLYGERRIGKTSIQHRLKKRLDEIKDPVYKFFPVFIDLQGTPQERFFATLAEDISQELAPILGETHRGPSASQGLDYQYRDLVRDIREWLKILKKTTSKKIKLVLLIDEVDELNDYDPRINQRLRGLFMKSFAEDLVAVVSGVGIKKHWESEGSPWYNFFEEVQVKPFRREDAEELIEKPIRGIFKLDNGVVDEIIRITDCRPYLIQKLCVALVNRLHEEKRRRISLADVAAIGRPKEA